jgi:hypothetical protein
MKYVQDYLNAGLPVTTAIQTAINDVYNSSWGGVVQLPAGNFTVNSTITLKGGVILQGEGRRATNISTAGADFNVILFDTTCSWAGLRDMFIVGCFTNSAQQNVVTVMDNCPVEISRCYIWGGNSAVYTKGVDGFYCDNFISGNVFSNLVSQGANWFVRCKFDGAGNSPQHGVYLGTPVSSLGGVMENSFDQCDFSGNFTSTAVCINDNNVKAADTSFHRCIFSHPINLQNHLITKFVDGKFGSSSFNPGTGVVVATGCHAVTGVNIPGGIKSANVGIS